MAPLHDACRSGDAAAVTQLIEQGAFVNAADKVRCARDRPPRVEGVAEAALELDRQGPSTPPRPAIRGMGAELNAIASERRRVGGGLDAPRERHGTNAGARAPEGPKGGRGAAA